MKELKDKFKQIHDTLTEKEKDEFFLVEQYQSKMYKVLEDCKIVQKGLDELPKTHKLSKDKDFINGEKAVRAFVKQF